MKYARVDTHYGDAFSGVGDYVKERFLYKITRFNPDVPTSFWIIDETGEELYCRTNGCAHLGGGNWKIVEVNSR